MIQYHQFSSEISLYPQQVSQELMAAFVIGKQYMQNVSAACRLCIVPEDISISRHSLVATLYYYIAQRQDIQHIVVISTDPRATAITLPSRDHAGIAHILWKKLLYDTDLSQRIVWLQGISTCHDDISLESASWYTHVHYVAMLPQLCDVLPIICPVGDISYGTSLLDCCLADPHTFVILMDSFAFRPYVDEQGQHDMQTLVYEPGGEVLRLFNHYVASQSWLFYALRVDKSPLPSDPERYTSLLIAG